ncbi:hypothetical protein GCM10007276_02060 [Agaricicola taiwanensis]|uniref:Uncharacterized protein n=1 Tax=Agaricicola taiwanensis TaxID=591372 RepID=A0A8J2VFF0_9RHOB|nr:hypothetical protein [Agaricicola taiwanensis]GGE28454.1 hypothetical protein GCM10007276_02060 [Agaricicola taiwanensis]
MNTANLQIEGILTAMSSLLEALRGKGLLTQQEIDEVLDGAERAVSKESEHRDELRAAHLAAIKFPIRFLRVTNNRTDGEPLSFGRIAAMVGETKPDQW